MPAKLTIPTRVQGQDDAQYTQAVKESIKSQRPYLTDDEVMALSSFEVSNAPKPKAVSVAKPIVTAQPKSQPFKTTSEMVDAFVPKQVEPKLELADPNKAAATARMLDKFIPQQPKEEDVAPTSINGIVNPYDLNIPTQENFDPAQAQKIRQSLPQAQSIRESFIAKPQLPKKDQFDAVAEIDIPQGSANEKLVYAETLRQNNEKIKQSEAVKASQEISDDDFNKAIQRDFIEKQDRGFVLEQKYGGFKDEINKSIREYMETPQFKHDVVRIAKEQGVTLNQAAQIALDQKSLDYAYAPSALEQKMQGFSDWAATNNIPFDYTAAKTAAAGLKGLTDVGAFGAAAFEAAVNSTQNMVKGDAPDYLNEFARRNAAIQRTSRVAVPQVQSEKASAFTQGVSDVTSMVAAIGVPMSVVPQVNMFTKAKNILSFGRGGEKALQQGLSAEAQLAAKSTTNANKLALDIGKVLQSKPANVTAKILDNTVQNYIVMGSPTMDAQRQKYLALGFGEEEANRRASGMTFLTNLALALPSTLRPHEMSIMDKVFNLGNFKEGAKAAAKQGAYFGVDMTALRATEEAIDNQALRNRGVEVQDVPFQQQLQDKFTHATKDFAVGVLMSVMGRMKYRQSDMQLAGVAEAFNNPEALNKSIKNSVKSGKVSQEDAVAFQTFLNTLKPEYDKAVNEVRNDGTPKFAPAIAAKVAIERTKAKQAEKALEMLENSVEKWTTYETDKDGKSIEKTIYRHSDGKMYDYEELKTKQQRFSLVGAVIDANKTVAQLEQGQYVKGKLVSANQMKAIVEANSLNGKAKEGQLEAIEANAPFENVEFEVVEFAKQPEIAKIVEEIKASGEIPQEMPSTNDPILNEKGEVVEGRTQVAHAIVRGGGKITFMKPLSEEKATEAANIALGEQIGSTEADKRGLGETDAIALDEVKVVYEKHLEENEGDFDGAAKAAVRDLQERQYTPEETKDMLKRLNGENSASEAIREGIYRDANKQTLEAAKTDADIENRMAEIEGNKNFKKEFDDLEKEMEKRERESVFNAPLEKVSETIDLLIKKEKEKPNGFGSFIENADAVETKEVANKYLNAKNLTDAEIRQDFSDAVRSNPATWYADGLKLRESLRESTNRGIDTSEMMSEVIKVYENEGYDASTARSVVANMLKPILESAKTKQDGTKTELGRTDGGSERQGEQGEGGTTIAEQGVVEPTEIVSERQDPISTAREKGLKDMSIAERMRQRASAIQEKNATFEKTKQNEKASEQNTDGESGKSGGDISQKPPKGKVTGTAKKRAKATIKNPTYLRALDVESPDATTQVMQYFIRGGRVSPEVIKELYKNYKGEMRSKIGFIKKEAPTLDGLAHSLWEEHTKMYGEGQDITTQDFKNAIEEVLNSYSSRSRMAEEVAMQHIDSYTEREYQELEEKAKAEAKEYEEYVGDAMDLFAELTEEQVDRIIAEDAMGEKEVEKALAKELAKEYITQAETPQSEQLSQKEKQLVKEEAKLSKLQQSLEVVGKENQFDIFGGKPSDSMLFETSVSDAEKVYKAQKQVVDALKTEISDIKSEIQTAKDSEVTANQIAMELPESKSNLEQASSFIRDAAAKLREQHDKDINDPNALQRQGGLSKKQVAIALEKIADIIDAVGDVEKAIKQFLDGIKDPKERKEYEKEIDNFFLEEYGEKETPKGKSSPKSEQKTKEAVEQEVSDAFEEVKDNMVERTLVSKRLKGSSIAESVKSAFTYGEQMREVDGHISADANAAKIIADVGIEEAYQMAVDREVNGALQKAIIGRRIVELDEAVKAEENAEIAEQLSKELKAALNLMEKRNTEEGGGTSYLAYWYANNPNIGLTTADKIAKWERDAGGKAATAEIREAYERLEKENKANLAELKKYRELAEVEDLQSIIDEVKSRSSEGAGKKEFTEMAKKAANEFRKLKSKPIELKGADGKPILDADGKPVVLQMQGLNFNELIEVGAKVIEQTGKIADGIKAIADKLSNEDWYKKLSKADKDAVLGQLTESLKAEPADVDTTEVLTTSVLKELVMKGYDTPELLFAKVKEFFPEGTSDRKIRDSITKYGQEIKQTQTEIGQKVSAIKSIWGKISQLEDAKSGVMPFRRSAPENKQFRDERRRKMNELREAMKNLDVPEVAMEEKWQTRIDTAKKRYQNAIADMEKAIKDGEVIVKNKAEKITDKDVQELQREMELVKEAYDEFFGQKEKLQIEAIDRAIDRTESLIKNNDLELKGKKKGQETLAVLAKREVYENVKKELFKAREEAGIIEKEQLRKRAEYLEKRIKYYEERVKKGDYSKKERKKSPTNDKINELLGKNDLLKFEEQKLTYLAQEQAKKAHLKALDVIADIWNIPRIQMATGEASFVGVQGRRLTGSYLAKSPKVVVEAFAKTIKAMKSKEGLAEVMSEIKTKNPTLYHAMKGSKLDITESSFKISATEENTQRIGGAFLWNLVFNNAIIPTAKGIDFVTGKDVTSWAKEAKEKPLYEVFERGAVAYNNFLRTKAFADFDALMHVEGKSFDNATEEYKLFADYLNTATGRGKLPLGTERVAELLSKVLFSPRNFSSELQLATTPLGVGKLAVMQLQSDRSLKDNFTETTAVKEAAKHQIRYSAIQLGLAVTSTMLLYSMMGSTDENEDNTGVELDPRSTKFGTATFKGGKTVDFFSGGLRYFILANRLATQEYKTADKVKLDGNEVYYQKGKVKGLGEGYVPLGVELIAQIAMNKINPTIGAIMKHATSKPRTELDKALNINRDKFGKRVSYENTFKELMTPIYYSSVKESLQNDPSVLDAVGQLQAFFAFAGYRVQNKEKEAREEAERVKKDIELYKKKKAMGLIK